MKKNKLFVIALLGYSVIALCGCVKREVKNLDSKGKNIICFGDSITFGYGVLPGEDYPSQLSRMLGVPVINAGLDADTSLAALGRLEKDVLEKDPFLVVIEFSGNDFLKKLPLQDTLRSISEMVDRIQAQGAIAAIADVSAGMFLVDYRRVLSQLARRKGAIFIPQLLGGIITTPSLKSDFIHPNAEGYKILAQRVSRAIRPYLKNIPEDK